MQRGLRLGDVVVRHVVALLALARRTALATLLVATIFAVFAPVAAGQDWAPPSKVWVEDTGHTVDKTFLRTWRANLAHLGNPITQEVRDRVKLDGVKTKERTLQYFQNGVLISTGDDKRGDDWHVRAIPLGEETLAIDVKRLKVITIAKIGNCDGATKETCRYFETTKHSVKHGFKQYWEKFQGEQLIGAPITEEFVASDGWTRQYFENGVLLWKKDKGVVARAIGKEAAARNKVKIAAVQQPAEIPTYAEALFSPPPPPVVVTTPTGPGPVQGGYKEIVISISQQYMWAYEEGATVAETYVSTGTAETPEVTTPIGYWSILTKYDSQTMEGTISNEYYRVEDVPWVMYFDNLGNALHGAYWHNNFGSPMSHGCVNLPLDIASFLYGWAEIGTPVTVIG